MADDEQNEPPDVAFHFMLFRREVAALLGAARAGMVAGLCNEWEEIEKERLKSAIDRMTEAMRSQSVDTKPRH